MTLSRDELDATVERLDAEWVAARGGDEELPPRVVDAIARVFHAADIERERTRRTMPRRDAPAAS